MILDDATSEIYYAQLAEEETTATVMAGLRAVIERKGLFCSLYSCCNSRIGGQRSEADTSVRASQVLRSGSLRSATSASGLGDG